MTSHLMFSLCNKKLHNNLEMINLLEDNISYFLDIITYIKLIQEFESIKILIVGEKRWEKENI